MAARGSCFVRRALSPRPSGRWTGFCQRAIGKRVRPYCPFSHRTRPPENITILKDRPSLHIPPRPFTYTMSYVAAMTVGTASPQNVLVASVTNKCVNRNEYKSMPIVYYFNSFLPSLVDHDGVFSAPLMVHPRDATLFPSSHDHDDAAAFNRPWATTSCRSPN